MGVQCWNQKKHTSMPFDEYFLSVKAVPNLYCNTTFIFAINLFVTNHEKNGPESKICVKNHAESIHHYKSLRRAAPEAAFCPWSSEGS
jgi:hypothetical protein